MWCTHTTLSLYKIWGRWIWGDGDGMVVYQCQSHWPEMWCKNTMLRIYKLWERWIWSKEDGMVVYEDKCHWTADVQGSKYEYEKKNNLSDMSQDNLVSERDKNIWIYVERERKMKLHTDSFQWRKRDQTCSSASIIQTSKNQLPKSSVTECCLSDLRTHSHVLWHSPHVVHNTLQFFFDTPCSFTIISRFV